MVSRNTEIAAMNISLDDNIELPKKARRSITLFFLAQSMRNEIRFYTRFFFPFSFRFKITSFLQTKKFVITRFRRYCAVWKRCLRIPYELYEYYEQVDTQSFYYFCRLLHSDVCFHFSFSTASCMGEKYRDYWIFRRVDNAERTLPRSITVFFFRLPRLFALVKITSTMRLI